MFGKVMSISDELIIKYFTLATRVPLDEIKQIEKELSAEGGSASGGKSTNPRDIKLRLATEIVTLYHGADNAKKAADEFDKVFSKKEKPADIKEVPMPESRIADDVLVKVGLAKSKSEARRLIEQGGVRVDDEKVVEVKDELDLKNGSIVQVGPRKFVKIKR
jgi:tyrosyl-tRNA synthetase